MRNWSIRIQLILLAIVPVVVTAFSLTAYFTMSQLRQISDNLQDHSRATANQIATISEYAVYSGDTTELHNSLHQALADKNMVSITIKDASDNTIIELKDNNNEGYTEKLLDFLLTDNNLTFEQPIFSNNTPLSDYYDESGGNDDVTNKHIGTVILTVTNYHINIKKAETLMKGGLISFGILILSTIIALRVSQQIGNPIQKLTNTVKNIAAGDLSVKLDLDAPAELGVLENCVTQMVNELKIAQIDIESRITDFTHELQETLEELEERNAELDIARSNALEASREKSEFLASMSHEIRTPLSGIIGFAELLESSKLDGQQSEYATIITESSRNLLIIIEEILDISKIESGKLNINTDDCDLIEVTETIITLLSPAAQSKSIELLYDIDPVTPHLIISDSVRIQQIMTNLIGNAIKFTENGYVHIRIELDPIDDNFIKIVVTDTGIGMSPDSRQNLFKAFSQADNSITRRFGGTGLGLVISRKLTELLGGNIGFSSTPDKGSSFWFTLPKKVSPNITSYSSNTQLQKMIALIDNNYLTVKSCKNMLESWGCKVDTFRFDTYAELFGKRKAKYDYYILGFSSDVIAAELTSATEKLSSNVSDAPIIVMTGSIDENATNQFIANGADAVISRNTPRQKILQTLQQAKFFSIKTMVDAGSESLSPEEQHLKDLDFLIVDDNETNLKLATIILNKSGLDIATAMSGRAALDMIQHHPFDVVFMDLHMPDTDGYQASRQIRELGNTIRQPYIIALTANAMPQERQKALEHGIDDILIKPISEQQVKKLLKQWLIKTHIKLNEKKVANGNEAEKIFSADEAIAISSHNQTLATEMITMLIDELPKRKQEINNAYRSGDQQHLKDIVHTLHGATRYCATPRLRNAILQYEQALGTQTIEELADLHACVNTEIDSLLKLDLNNLFSDQNQ